MGVHRIQSDLDAEAFVGRLRRQFLRAIAVLVGIVATSSVVMAFLGDHDTSAFGPRLVTGFWDTLNLVSTVGSLRGVRTPGQQAWAMLVIIFGLGAVLYAYGSLQALFQGGEVFEHFARKRMVRSLESLSGHFVVCGFGTVGAEVARRLKMGGREIVIIERADDVAERAEAAGHLVVHADATGDDALRLAGVARAAGLVATLDSDAANTYLTLLAREASPEIRIVTRGERDASRGPLRRAGAERVIVPGETAGQQLSQLILHPRLSEIIARAEGRFEFAEIDLGEHPNFVGRPVSELTVDGHEDVVVISIIGADEHSEFKPMPSRVLRADDTVLVLGRKASE